MCVRMRGSECVPECVCLGGTNRKKERMHESIYAQKLLSLDFGIRPAVTDAYELIYFRLY